MRMRYNFNQPSVKTGMERDYTLQENANPTLLDCMIGIVKEAPGSELCEKYLASVQSLAMNMSKRLGISPIQAIFLSIIADQTGDDAIRQRDIAEYLNISNIEMIKYNQDLMDLVQRKYLAMAFKINDSSALYVCDRVYDAVKKNSDLEEIKLTGLTPNEFWVRMVDIFTQRRNQRGGSFEFFIGDIGYLIDSNPEVTICKKLLKEDLSEICAEEIVILLALCGFYIFNNDKSMPVNHVLRYLDSSITADEYVLKIRNEELDIMRKFKYVDFVNEKGMAIPEMVELTDKAIEDLLSDVSIAENPNSKDFIRPEDIVAKTLYYNAEEAKQIDRLTNLLDKDYFQKVQQNLKESGLRTGFACLFYGLPGTGKTETALQLARNTGRGIIQVDLSETKSKWVGGSEKQVKAIFDRYRRIVKNSKIVPILLLNEADGLIGKRNIGAEQAVDKMENTVQNIILQEMENLDGILIATTNLTENMDSAFERRFLYKVKFDTPCINARKSIWRSMLGGMKEEDYEILANRYSFSGGQIENIVRKRVVDSILNDRQETTLEEIIEYCKTERIKETGKSHIGFAV